jgi:hypothetical protein
MTSPIISMSRANKFILVAAVIFLIYGFLCRIIKINFFWDSSDIGWILLFVALLLYWINLRKKRREQGKKTIWMSIGIFLLYLGLGVLPVVGILMRNSEAYHAATEYLKADINIKTEVGNVKGFGLFPGGEVQETTINGVKSGSARLAIIVKGSKKYMDVIIDLVKLPNRPWKVTDLRSRW